ncbi:MAG: ester cyclase [Thermoplasmata archaeon]
MSAEELNKTLVREFLEEAWNKGNLMFVDEHFADDFVPHFLPPNLPANREGFKQHISMWQTAFPDFRGRAEDVIAEGDRVVLRWDFQGTNKGEFMGIPATGKEGRVTGISAFRLADGKVCEAWAESDSLGLLVQLGLAKPPWER